jgi:hypothetical protein
MALARAWILLESVVHALEHPTSPTARRPELDDQPVVWPVEPAAVVLLQRENSKVLLHTEIGHTKIFEQH